LTAAPGQTVTISGLNLSGASAITFGGVSGTVTNSTATTVTAVVPNGAISGPVQITTPLGTCSSLTNFYIAPYLSWYFIPSNYNTSYPRCGDGFEILPGSQLTIVGGNFDNIIGVQINGVPCSSFNLINENRIRTVVPPGVSGGPVTVTTTAGSSTIGIPKITGFSPLSGAFGTLISI
jgi:hypothetical protein